MVRRHRALAPLIGLALGLPGCGEDQADAEGVALGLLLSYSGQLAANSANSERAVFLAVEAANAAGGVAGQPLRVLAGDTRSDSAKALLAAEDLLAAGAAMFIGPDTTDVAVQLRSLFDQQALILPSYTTAHHPFRKPNWWFVMGAGTARVACELVAQLAADGRKAPMVLADSSAFDQLVGWELVRRHGMTQFVLPDQSSSSSTVQPIAAAPADAFVLLAQPPSASSLVYSMAALGALKKELGWYLSPTLHTPALLATIPKGALAGARGVAPGKVAGAAEFRHAFQARWQDQPLDDAYSFYDATAVAILALERAHARGGQIPRGEALGQHVLAVTHAGSTPVGWNEIARGLSLLRQGQEVEYLGLSGPLQFDQFGEAPEANTSWWTIENDQFVDIPAQSNCQ
jgi:ABC-type branched-subunit amino acid transport system substrate-binding protein